MASHRNPFVANQKYFLWIVGKSELGIQFISSEKTPDEDLFCLQGGNYQSIRQGLNVWGVTLSYWHSFLYDNDDELMEPGDIRTTGDDDGLANSASRLV